MAKIFIDLENIALNNGENFENAISKVEYKASKNYIEYLGNLLLNDNVKEEEYRVLLDEAYDLKDRVLEEVDDAYKGRIDYTSLYGVTDSNREFVNNICDSANDNEVFITFYYNTIREQNEKMGICRKYFPNCKPLAVRFYQKRYDKKFTRERTNKAFFAMSILGLDSLDGCLLIDKSPLNCAQWQDLGGYVYLYSNGFPKKDDSSVLKIAR